MAKPLDHRIVAARIAAQARHLRHRTRTAHSPEGLLASRLMLRAIESVARMHALCVAGVAGYEMDDQAAPVSEDVLPGWSRLVGKAE